MTMRRRVSCLWSGAFARSRQSGLTLIELIVSVVLLAILAAAGVGMFYDSFTTTRMVNATQDNASQARYALERMEREIRETMIVTDDDTRRTGTIFRFTKTPTTAGGPATTVTIALSGSNLTLCYHAIATEDCPSGNVKTLSSAISSNPGNVALFRYLAADGITTATTAGDVRMVEITLTLSVSTTVQSITQRSRVALRNVS